MAIFRNFSQYKLKDNHKYLFFALLLCTLHFALCASIARAQDEQPKDAEPPPLKMISKEEKAVLEAETEIKKRTDLSLRYLDARLKKAEELNTAQSYEEMFTELGGFHALLDHTLNFLNRNDNGSKKILNNYKRLEITLRGYLSRLEIIRRDLPRKYEFYVRGLVKTVRDARTKAVEPLFSDTVLPNKSNMITDN
jgi:hypothetical protein